MANCCAAEAMREAAHSTRVQLAHCCIGHSRTPCTMQQLRVLQTQLINAYAAQLMHAGWAAQQQAYHLRYD